MEQPVIQLSLTVEAVNIILAGLGELPAKHSKLLIDQIEFTAKQQLASAQEVQQANDVAEAEKPAGDTEQVESQDAQS